MSEEILSNPIKTDIVYTSINPSVEDENNNCAKTSLPSTRIKTSFNNLLRRVTETQVVGTAVDYVKIVNDRYPIVKSVTGPMNRIIDITIPVVNSAIIKFDNSVDGTYRIVDKCMLTDYTIFKTVNLKFVNTKTKVYDQASSLWSTSQTAYDNLHRKKTEIINTIQEKKNCFSNDFTNIFSFNYNLLSLQNIKHMFNQNVVISISSNFKLFIGNSIIAIAEEIKDKKKRVLQLFDLNNIYRINISDYMTNMCKSLSLNYFNVMDNLLNIATNKKIIVEEQVTEVVTQFRARAKDIMLRVPEERRTRALELNIKLFGFLKRYIGDSKANYVMENVRGALNIVDEDDNINSKN